MITRGENKVLNLHFLNFVLKPRWLAHLRDQSDFEVFAYISTILAEIYANAILVTFGEAGEFLTTFKVEAFAPFEYSCKY